MGESTLALMKEMLDLIDGYARSVSRDLLEHDREAWLKVKAALELAAQCAIDLALALISARGLGVPQSYREAFTTLSRAGMITSSLSAELEKWAGLRNVLVHIYTSLDLDRLHGALSETSSLRQFHAIVSRELMRDNP
jgi:uncharacterized protein YutE (UPF0331/DUF86 family)